MDAFTCVGAAPVTAKELFNTETFYSLAGASGIVYVVCSALQGALNFNPRWLALVLSEIIAIYGAQASGSIQVPSDYFIATLNGCLVYCTAVGGNALGHGAKAKGRPKGYIPGNSPAMRRSFASSWF